jgi:hypothetical protein
MYKGKIEGRFLMLMKVAEKDNELLSCCTQMSFHFREKEKIIGFELATRRLGIRIRDNIFQLIKYCPWCAAEKPKDLTNELDQIIFEQLKLDGFDDERLPEEFKTDEWWKKRGL